jgi:hypothetical protein
MPDGEIFLKLSVEDQGKVQKLNDSLSQTEARVRSLSQAFKADPFGAFTVGPQLDRATVQLRGYQNELDKLAAKAARPGPFGGRRLLEFGQAFQDFEAAGFRGIVNQVDRLALALGTGTGLAGAAIVAATAFNALLPKIQEFLESMKSEDITTFSGHVDRLAVRLKKLADAPTKTAADILEIRAGEKAAKDLKAGEAALTEFREAVPEEDAARGKIIREFLVSPEGKAAVEEMIRRRATAGNPEIAERQAELTRLDAEIAQERAHPTLDSEGRAMPGVLQGAMARRARLADALNQARLDAEEIAGHDVGNILRRAFRGDSEALGEELRSIGRDDLIQGIGEALAAPEEEAATIREQERLDESNKNWIEYRKKRDKARKDAANRESEELEGMGQLFQEMGDAAKKASNDQDKRAKGEAIDQGQGRLKWLRTLQGQERDPQIFGDMTSYLNSVQGAGGAEGLNKTNSLLEREIKIQEAQLEALRNMPANVGP